MSVVDKINKALTKTMAKLADHIGEPIVLVSAAVLIVGWFVARLFLEYDVWSDIMDVTVFLTTFFLLFIVQASQNADTKAIQDKLDELIEAIPAAKTSVEGEEKAIKKGKKRSRADS